MMVKFTPAITDRDKPFYDAITIRDVVFPRGETIDLDDNPKLFAKVSVLPYFLVVGNEVVEISIPQNPKVV